MYATGLGPGAGRARHLRVAVGRVRRRPPLPAGSLITCRVHPAVASAARAARRPGPRDPALVGTGSWTSLGSGRPIVPASPRVAVHADGAACPSPGGRVAWHAPAAALCCVGRQLPTGGPLAAGRRACRDVALPRVFSGLGVREAGAPVWGGGMVGARLGPAWLLVVGSAASVRASCGASAHTGSFLRRACWASCSIPSRSRRGRAPRVYRQLGIKVYCMLCGARILRSPGPDCVLGAALGSELIVGGWAPRGLGGLSNLRCVMARCLYPGMAGQAEDLVGLPGSAGRGHGVLLEDLV